VTRQLAFLFSALCRRSPKLRRVLWREWYQFLARMYPRRDWAFMNYGFAGTNAQGEAGLEVCDEPDRYFIQLYHHVATLAPLDGRDVLEVGSGRGGGASYVARYLRPRTMTGVDFAPNAVRLARRRHRVSGLTFAVGSAEALPFDDGSFDAVVNVESSHCYPSMDRFLGEVRRVLRPRGHFHYADFRDRPKLAGLERQLDRCGLEMVKKEDITGHVVAGLDRNDERTRERIKRLVHAPLVSSFLEFAGVRGSRIYKEFASRECVYVSCLMRKGA
jgi:ubiquinone/menaquinone biosynthesis C-methylase UbiE